MDIREVSDPSFSSTNVSVPGLRAACLSIPGIPATFIGCVVLYGLLELVSESRSMPAPHQPSQDVRLLSGFHRPGSLHFLGDRQLLASTSGFHLLLSNVDLAADRHPFHSQLPFHEEAGIFPDDPDPWLILAVASPGHDTSPAFFSTFSSIVMRSSSSSTCSSSESAITRVRFLY
jgi:hypothetical protein